MAEIAIAGPGLMGLGIAQVCARAGHRVCLLGRDAGSAERGRTRLASHLQRQVERGRMQPSDAAALLGRVRAASGDADLAACRLAIESVPEDRSLKLDVLRRLEQTLPAGTLIATNTSGLPVGGLVKALHRPEVLVAISVFAAYLDEALALVAEGVAPAGIEQAALALGRAIGPLALLDDISLALNLQQIRQARADGLPPPRCRPLAEPVLAALVGQGRCGRRDGGAFYDAAPDGTRMLWSGLAGLFPPAPRQPAPQRIAERLRCAEVLDALRCLEEGVIASADDADIASVLGLGFPRASGGVLAWAEAQGLDHVVATCDTLVADCGERFAPSDWLRARARSGGLRAWRDLCESQEMMQ